MTAPNEKAVEALERWEEENCNRAPSDYMRRIEVVPRVRAVEPHIRAQVLRELAEEFEGWARESERGFVGREMQVRAAAHRDAAERCRDLAAKEESDDV